MNFTYDNNCLTAPFAMPLALSLDMSFVLLLDMSFAKILVMILCHLLYHQIYHSLPIGYSTLALTLATILVMVFCHLLYHQIFHWLFFWYVTSNCIGCPIRHDNSWRHRRHASGIKSREWGKIILRTKNSPFQWLHTFI